MTQPEENVAQRGSTDGRIERAKDAALGPHRGDPSLGDEIGEATGGIAGALLGAGIGSSPLTANTATLNATLPFPGVYSVTAYYAGDGSNSASTSPGVGQAITGSTVMQVNAQTSTLFHSVNVTVTLQ